MARQMTEQLLTAHAVWAGYSGNAVLSDISFTVARGDFVSIIAPNGTGKSTLLRCIAGVLPLIKGSISVAGKALNAYSRRELAQMIAVVGEEDFTFDYTVQQAASMGRYAHIGRFGTASEHDRQAVEQALKSVGLWEKRHSKMSKLSQGERQKTLIARALAQCPQLLLLDEPTSHLDVRNQFVILSLIKQLIVNSKMAVVAVIHDINLALAFSTHLLLLKDGEMLAYGRAADVLSVEVLKKMYGLEFQLHHSNGSLYVQPCFN